MTNEELMIICDAFADSTDCICDYMRDEHGQWCSTHCKYSSFQPSCLIEYIALKKDSKTFRSKEKNTVEFIDLYRRVGDDYQYADNHGELIRCADCCHWIYNGTDSYIWCQYMSEKDYCSRADRITSEEE